MQNQLYKISDQERKQLIEAPVLITLLIAGADGEFSPTEAQWAEKVVGFRKDTAHYTLQYYYELVSDGFDKKLEDLHSYYGGMNNRSTAIQEELSKLKPILSKLDEHYREKLIESYKSLAKQIAESSGGILGFFSRNKEEEALMKLEMFD